MLGGDHRLLHLQSIASSSTCLTHLRFCFLVRLQYGPILLNLYLKIFSMRVICHMSIKNAAVALFCWRFVIQEGSFAATKCFVPSGLLSAKDKCARRE